MSMEILSEATTGMGSKFILAKFSDTFYGYGTVMDFRSPWGLPVNQCGTKEEVIANCERMMQVNKDYIEQYQKEFDKNKTEGWKSMLECEKIELEMHTKFAKKLRDLL